MRTVIFSGIIGELGKSGRYKGGLSFTLGEPPVTFYSPGDPEAAPFRPGDPVAIAARRTFVPGAQYVALAPSSPPRCPKCGGDMVRRSNRQTRDHFWGCATHPACRGTRAA